MAKRTAILLALAAAASAQEGTHVLVEQFEPGLRRSETIARRAWARLETSALGQVTGRSEPSTSQEATVHEWYREVDASTGRPRIVVRTYEVLRTVESSRVESEFLPEPLVDLGEVLDQRAGQTLVLELGADGSRRIVGGAERIVQERDRRRAEVEFETDLLPARPVAVGETWRVPLERVEDPFGIDLGFVAEFGSEGVRQSDRGEGELTVRLDGVAPGEGGRRVATLVLQGRLAYRRVKKVPYLETVEEDTTTTYQLEGVARFDVEAGRWLSREVRARFERAGTPGGATGAEATGEGGIEDRRAYAYGWIFDDPPAVVPDEPESVEAPATFPVEVVASGELAIGRNPPRGARISTFDPATGREGRVLAVLPAPVAVDHLTLSDDRRQVAFASTLNNEISHDRWNVFVLVCGSGRIDQVTPAWAPGEGLARPLETGDTGRIRGRVTWYDSVRRLDLSNVIDGAVHVDRTRRRATLTAGGGFEVGDVPIGPVVVQIEARVSHGEGRYRETVTMGAYALATVRAGETVDVGTVAISAPFAWFNNAHPTWVEGGIWGMNFGTDFFFRAGRPARSYEMGQLLGALGSTPGGLSAAPDGKRLALFDEPVGSPRVRVFDAADRREVVSLAAGEPGFQLDPDSRGSWRPGTDDWFVCGHTMGRMAPILPDVPALVAVDLAAKEARIVKRWPEFAGRRFEDVTTDREGRVVYLVLREVAAPEGPGTERADLFGWDPATDTTRRLTGWGDVASVSNVGR